MDTDTRTWYQVIEEARERGEFTYDEYRRSLNWVTCACGEQDARIPRYGQLQNVPVYYLNAPVDPRLNDLGANFPAFVKPNAFDAAAEILGKIEDRASEILVELAKTSTPAPAPAPAEVLV